MGMDKFITLMIIIFICTTNTRADQLVRQNIGLIYEQLPGQLITGHDNHQIILAVPYSIPKVPRAKPPIYGTISKLQLTTLGPQDSQNSRILQQAADLDKLILNIDINIITTMKNILHFLSDPINTRSKRAIFAFLGELFKSVFGLATTKDIDQIINTIQQLDSKLGTLADINVKTVEGLVQITKRQQDFLDTYVKQQDAVQEALLNITESIDSWSDDFSTTLTSLQAMQDRTAAQSAVISAQTVVLMTRLAYQQGLAKVENSLRLLSTGILAPDMIRPTELADKLQLLDNNLKINNPGSEVSIMNTAYYYSQPVALYTYSKTHLYIHINVIISSTDSAFNLFQIIKTDVPIDTENTNSTGTTKIVTDITFLAVNQAETLYLEMNNADLLTCPGNILKVCSRTMPRIRSDSPTCHIAAYRDDQAGIARLCNFQIQPLKPITTKAIAINKDRYLVTTNQEYYHIICQHKTPTTRKATAYSVVGVPCLCHLQFDGLYLPNTQIPCNNTLSTHFTMHTANIPILLAFATQHTPVSPSSLHYTPITMPHLHTEAIIRALAPIQHLPSDVTLDLLPFTKKLLEDAEHTATVLHTPLRSTPISDSAAAFFNSPIWKYVSPIIMTVETIVMIILIFKVLGRQAAFIPIPHAAAKPLNITWRPSLTLPTQQKTQPMHVDQYVDAENIITIMTIALIVYAIVKLSRCLKAKVTKHFGFTKVTSKTNPSITLKIYNGMNNHTIPLLSLPHELDVIERGFSPELKDIKALSCPHPRINMTWAGPITFMINGKRETFYLPSHVILPLRARFSIIPALRDPTTTTALILKTDSTVISLPYTNTYDHTDSSNSTATDSLIHPKDMTTTQLLQQLVKERSQPGNEQ